MENSLSLDRIISRSKDILTLKERTYREIVNDPSATTEAAIVVAAVSVAGGLGHLFSGPFSLIGGVLSMLIGWIVGAAVIYFVGTRITGEPTTASSVERVMRIVGYASVPGIFSIFAGIWGIGWIIALVVGILTLVTLVYAIRASLNMTTSRAIVTGVIAWIATLLVVGVMNLIFGINPQIPF